MSLRRKILLVMILGLTSTLLVLYVLISGIITESFLGVDRLTTLRNLDRTTNHLNSRIDSLQRNTNDWSSWDETYEFVSGNNPEYISDNLTDESMLSININLMVFINNEREIVYAKAVDLHADWQNSAIRNFEAYARSEERFLRLLTTTPTSGFVMMDGEPMLIASRPILHNDETGPSAGTLVWGQHISADELSSIGQLLRLSLNIFNTGAPTLPDDVLSAQQVLSPATLRTTSILSETNIAAYTYFNDIFGQPSLIIRLDQERSAYLAGRDSLQRVLLILAVTGMLTGIIVLLLLERLFLVRVSHLNEQLGAIAASDDISLRLPVRSKDEISGIAATINTMLDAVAESREVLRRSNSHLELQGSQSMIELERQKSNLQAIMDTMGEGLVYCIDGLITYVNRAFVDLLQYEVSDLVGKPFNLLSAHPDPAQTPVFFKLPRRYETTLTRRDGTNVNVAITSTPVESSDERRSQVIIVRDITQEIATKRQKDYFFARASHDLRSPLTNIMTRLYLLSKKPEQLETHLKILEHISSQMLTLVNDLLDVSRFERGVTVLNRRDLVLQTIVEQVVAVQQADAEIKHIDLHMHLNEVPLQVYGDPVRLNQVITNLVSNAIHYTPEGGQIAIDVGFGEREGAKCALVTIADTGIGIARDHLEHIFEPFYRVSNEREGGTGLGLYIVQEIIQLHGGEITVASEVGKGTTFSVHLHLSGTTETSHSIVPSALNLH